MRSGSPRGPGATAPCAAASVPSVSRFLVGCEERESEGLGVGQRQAAVRRDVETRRVVGRYAVRVGRGRVADLPAFAGAGVAPVDGATFPVQLALVGGLGDVAPARAGDSGDRAAGGGHDALLRISVAAAKRTLKPSRRARSPDRSRPSAASAAVRRIRAVRQSSHGQPGAPWRGGVVLIGVPPLEKRRSAPWAVTRKTPSKSVVFRRFGGRYAPYVLGGDVI